MNRKGTTTVQPLLKIRENHKVSSKKELNLRERKDSGNFDKLFQT